MTATVTVVTYHYVRDLARSRYPGIKGITLERFREQVEGLARSHTMIPVEELDRAVNHGAGLPENPALLTFDDGFMDHFVNVFPLLNAMGVPGAFFVSAKPLAEGRAMDTHKIHFILAAAGDGTTLAGAVDAFVRYEGRRLGLEALAAYRARWARPGRWDEVETFYVKRMLQQGLPEVARRELVDRLFAKYVGLDEKTFTAELYMRPDHLRCLLGNGMHVGNHTWGHPFLDRLCLEEQRVWRRVGLDPGRVQCNCIWNEAQ